MSLDEFLTKKSISTAAFATSIGVTAESVRLFRLGRRIPRPRLMAVIEKKTAGTVTANDFNRIAVANREEGAAA